MMIGDIDTSLPREARWIRLKTDLRDLALLLNGQGDHADADMALMLAARVGELQEIASGGKAWPGADG